MEGGVDKAQNGSVRKITSVYSSQQLSYFTNSTFLIPDFKFHFLSGGSIRMKMLLKKISAVLLCAVITGAAAVSVPIFVPDSGITASAAVTSDRIEYLIYNNEVSITGYSGSNSAVVIPSKISGKDVTSISWYAFEGHTGIKSITIPSTMKYIGNGAFSGCTGLTSITMPKNVERINVSAFYYCTGLKSINVDPANSYYSSKDGILYNHSGSELIFCPGEKTNVTVLKGVSSICDVAFYGCKGLTGISIPDGVNSIGHWAFYGCTGLKSVSVSKSVKTIDEDAFCGCTGLTGISVAGDSSFYSSKDGILYNKDGSSLLSCPGGKTITSVPSGVTSIGNYAFCACAGMKSLTVPKSVVKIGDFALGYYYDADTFVQQISGFTVYGAKGSAAEKYADDNGLKFVEKTDSIPVSGITLSKTSITIKKGSSASIKATVSPSNATDKTVKWETNKSHIASVDKTGLIKANSCGTAIITAKTSNGKTAICNVTVYEPLKNNSEISASEVTVNSPVTLTGKAAGGTAPYRFAYYYRKSTDSTWTKIAGYSTVSSQTFRPTSAGTYTARVNVKDSTGKMIQKDFTVTVKIDLKNNSEISASEVTVNSPVTLTGKASGGKASYKFSYYYKKANANTWTKAYVTQSGSAYTTKTSVSFNPASAGVYDVRINVKDDNGTVVQKNFSLTVNSSALELPAAPIV